MSAYATPQQPSQLHTQLKENQQAVWGSSKTPVLSPIALPTSFPLQSANQAFEQTHL